MLERFRAALAVLTSSSPSAAAAPLATPGQRAELYEIKVNGLDAAIQNAVWLTKGLDRSQPATVVRLVDCTTTHLKNIVANKPNLSGDYLHIIEAILESRGETLDPSDIHPDFAS